jgi:hypothetical protein
MRVENPNPNAALRNISSCCSRRRFFWIGRFFADLERAEAVQLKRAYAPPSPEDGSASSQSYADGSGMIRADGSSSAVDTRLSSLIN